MKPIIIYSDKFLDFFSWFMRIGGITLFPFIILREKHKGTKRGEIVVNHESIHIQQALEMLVIPFYIAYGLNYFINLFRKTENGPYKAIVFEKEANANENNLNYLKERKLYAWTKCFRKNSCPE